MTPDSSSAWIGATPLSATWVKVLGWCELVGGVAGALSLLVSAIVRPGFEPGWSLLLPLAFLLTAAYAGFLLLHRIHRGVRLSIWVQALQVIGFSIGWRFVAHAGPYVTLVIASTGGGIWGGAGGEVFAGPAPNGTLAALGFGFSVNTGFFGDPLATASATVGINFVAIYFLVHLVRLRKTLATVPQWVDVPVAMPVVKLMLKRAIVIGVSAFLILVVAALHKPTKTLNLPDGRYFDVLQYDRNTSLLYDAPKGTWEREERLLVKYYTHQGTPDSMMAEARGLAPLFFKTADSLGLREIMLNPSKPLLTDGFPLLLTSWNVRFVRDNGGAWREMR